MNFLSVSAIPKIVALLLLICLTRAAAGSCLSYGHSCWGGHGKRSASLRHLFNPSVPEKRNDEWYFSKLFKFLKDRPVGSSTVYKARLQDSGLMDTFDKTGHQKSPFMEITDDTGTRNQDLLGDLDDTLERGSVDNNDGDSEMFVIPDGDDSLWKSRLHPYQNLGDISGKENSL